MGAKTVVPAVTTPLVALTKSRAPALQRLKGGAFRRVGWGFADQFVSSMTNYAVSVYLSHTLIAADFGAFALSYLTYGFVLNASRGLATDPLMVRFSDASLSKWRRAVADCTGTAIVVGLTAGICVIGVAAALSGTARGGFLALGLTLPGLMLQDSWRYSFFALGRGGHAFLNDAIWGLALIPALLLLRSTGHVGVFWAVFAWGASAGLAALIGPFQARVIPKVTGTWRWVRRHGDLGIRYLIEGTASSAAIQIRGYGTGLMVGLTAVGYIQATTTLIGPMTILSLAFPLVLIPEGTRVLRRGTAQLRLFCIAASVGLAAIGAAWGVIIWLGLPRGLGNAILGPIWHQAYPLMLPTMVGVIGANIKTGVGVGLHALGASKRSLNNVLFGAIIWIVLSLAGAYKWGAAGALWGTSAAIWVTLPSAWWTFHIAMREYEASLSASGKRRRGRGRHARVKSRRFGRTQPGRHNLRK
jgi:O-antigen/teichoic acid export membrane protein